MAQTETSPNMEVKNSNDKEQKTITLKASTNIDGKVYKKGEKLPVTEDLKKKLKPFGYSFKS